MPADLGGGVRKEQWCWRQGEALLIGEDGRLTVVLNVAGIRFCVPVKDRYQLEGLGGEQKSHFRLIIGSGFYLSVLKRR